MTGRIRAWADTMVGSRQGVMEYNPHGDSHRMSHSFFGDLLICGFHWCYIYE